MSLTQRLSRVLKFRRHVDIDRLIADADQALRELNSGAVEPKRSEQWSIGIGSYTPSTVALTRKNTPDVVKITLFDGYQMVVHSADHFWDQFPREPL